jgi:transposase
MKDRHMELVNKYCHRSHIPEWKFRQVIKCFAMDLEATKIAEFSGVSRNSVNKILKALRKRMAEYCENQSPLSAEIEVDETCFPDEDNQKNHDDWSRCNIPVFVVIKRKGKVYTQFISNCSRKLLHAVIKGKIDLNNIVRSEHSYDSIVDLSSMRHYRVNNNHGGNNMKSYINGVENFWGIAKMRLSKFRGLNRNMYNLHLKETEFRFNNREEDLYKILLQMLRDDPLKLS